MSYRKLASRLTKYNEFILTFKAKYEYLVFNGEFLEHRGICFFLDFLWGVTSRGLPL